jgi:metal-responsive CopG/Arc/MetJ family transcriptional regulator
MKDQTIRTTITIPEELLTAADRAVSQGKAKSRNEFVAQAILHELEALKRAEIDAALAEMAQDPAYQAEVLKMEAEFALASWEALHLEESLSDAAMTLLDRALLVALDLPGQT